VSGRDGGGQPSSGRSGFAAWRGQASVQQHAGRDSEPSEEAAEVEVAVAVAVAVAVEVAVEVEEEPEVAAAAEPAVEVAEARG
jgi:hypothetical protein